MKMRGLLTKNYEEFQDGTNRALNQALATRASRYHSRSRRARWSLPSAPLCLSQAPALTPAPLLSLQQQHWAPEACRPFRGDRQGCAARQDCRTLAGLRLRPNSSGPQGAVSPRWPLVSPQAHSQDIEKLKSQYRVLARDSAQARRKYQEASKGVWLPFLGERESQASPDPPMGICPSVPFHTTSPCPPQTRTETRPRTSMCAACGSCSLITTATCWACGPRSCTTSTTTSSCSPACYSRCRTCTRRWPVSCKSQPQPPLPCCKPHRQPQRPSLPGGAGAGLRCGVRRLVSGSRFSRVPLARCSCMNGALF